MRITEQNTATMVTINLKVSMCRDIIANSNITKAYVVNPCDFRNTQGKTAMNTDFDGVNKVRADTAHTLCKSAQVRLSTAQVRVKSVVIPCTYPLKNNHACASLYQS